MHDGFPQLQVSAANCDFCRLMERTILLKLSVEEESQLLGTRSSEEVVLKLHSAAFRRHGNAINDIPFNFRLQVTLGKGAPSRLDKGIMAYHSRVWKDSNIASRFVDVDANPYNRAIYDKTLSWLDACQNGHKRCENLVWSQSKPTRLIEIIDQDQLQLVDGGKADKYVALSYCWGDKTILPSSEWDLIEKGKTTESNKQKRYAGFLVTDLPLTLRDAIIFTHNVGIRYIWIDAVCIIQDSTVDKEEEIYRMHEYYGNSIFTLCIGAASRATEGFLRTRTAWQRPGMVCEAENFKFVSEVPLFEDAHKQTVLSQRGWTLEEDCLSQRKIYWFHQFAYWSCSQGGCIEGFNYPADDTNSKSFGYRSFLGATMFQGGSTSGHQRMYPSMHFVWLDVVESFVSRELYKAKDRLPAVAGIAIRYLAASSPPNQYIAGLWRTTFAQDLLWTTKNAVDKDPKAQRSQIYPSWSWASLPMRTKIFYPPGSQDYEAGVLRLDPDSIMNQAQNATQKQAVSDGNKISQVEVRGRIREIHSASLKVVDWRPLEFFDLIVDKCAVQVHVDGVEVLLGKIDYLADVARIAAGSLTVYCLEVLNSTDRKTDTSAALLLEERVKGKIYSRIGVSKQFTISSDFFEGSSTETIFLV
ncbi:hypothetical protein VE03_03261 [Pseudogymnoascus sp. 23342-1-I1]|nr:hypothetical protein VE03_03261 [Pseudogymnoascus sp. 23342-1-I1]